jgi:hypothetical protein
MNKTKESTTFIRYNEAGELTKAISDKRVRALVEYGLTTVLVRRGMEAGVTRRQTSTSFFSPRRCGPWGRMAQRCYKFSRGTRQN